MVTMEKFNVVIAELKHQIESQNRVILEKLDTLLNAQRESTNLYVENGPRINANSFTSSYRENVKSYTSGLVRRIGKESQHGNEKNENNWGLASSKTPFTKRISRTLCPEKFVFPYIPSYGGTNDPVQFIRNYDQQMDGAGATDEMKCRYFPTCLKGQASLWFSRLSSNSIDEFSDLAWGLGKRFQTLICQDNNAISMPATFGGSYKGADEYILMERTRLATQDRTTASAVGVTDSNDTDGKKETRGQKRRNDNDRKEVRKAKKLRTFKTEDCTPLNDTPENIYFATKNTVSYPEVPKLRIGKKGKSSGEFCFFHNQMGHDTNECRHLRSSIEDLVRKNQLQRYVQKGMETSSSTQGA